MHWLSADWLHHHPIGPRLAGKMHRVKLRCQRLHAQERMASVIGMQSGPGRQ